MAFSPGGELALTGSWDCTAILWDLRSGQARHVLRGHTGHVGEVRFSSDGGLAFTAAEDGTVRLWDVQSGKQIRAFAHHSTASVKGLAVLPGDDSAFTSSDNDGTLRIWRLDWPVRLRERSERLSRAQEVLNGKPGDANALRELGDWYAFRGKWDRALELLERARAAGAEVSPTTLARCYWRNGRSTEAHELFARAAEAGEAPADYLRLCADAVRRAPATSGMTLAAATTGAAPQADHVIRARANLGFMRLGRLTHDVERRPDDPGILHVRAECLLSYGRFEEAVPDYDRLVQLAPDNHMYWFYRGCLLAYLGREREYREHCQSMLKRFADDPDVGVIDRTTKTALLLPDGAGGDLELLSRRAGLLVDDPWSTLVKGMSDLRTGRYDRAAAWFEQCGAAQPDDRPARSVAADAYLAIARHRLGQEPEARAALERAVRRTAQDLRPADDGYIEHLTSVGTENWLISQTALREAEATVLGWRPTGSR